MIKMLISVSFISFLGLPRVSHHIFLCIKYKNVNNKLLVVAKQNVLKTEQCKQEL